MRIFGFGLLWLLDGASAGSEGTDLLHPAPVCSITQWIPTVCVIHDEALGRNQSTINTNPPIQSPWIKGSLCCSLNGDQFCAFTEPFFNSGQGVTVITTPETFARLALESAFQETSDESSRWGPATAHVPYRDAKIPGKGIGLIATRPIRAGDPIMTRTPAVMVDGKAYASMNKRRLADLLAHAVGSLPSTHMGHFLNLSTHDPVQDDMDRAFRIFTTNAFRTPVGDAKLDLHSTFTEVSRLNHDCQPNCVYYFDDKTLSLKVFAATDIMPGEELTVSYIDTLQPRGNRQAQLHGHWGFKCNCHRCTAEPHIAGESDDRVAQILELWAELDSYAASSTATPAKAELLVELFELEGAAGRMHEAFYRAALEWNGVGDAVKAAGYARRCLDRGLRFKGPNRPFIESMRALLKEPEMHWSWRFRVEGQ